MSLEVYHISVIKYVWKNFFRIYMIFLFSNSMRFKWNVIATLNIFHSCAISNMNFILHFLQKLFCIYLFLNLTLDFSWLEKDVSIVNISSLLDSHYIYFQICFQKSKLLLIVFDLPLWVFKGSMFKIKHIWCSIDR